MHPARNKIKPTSLANLIAARPPAALAEAERRPRVRRTHGRTSTRAGGGMGDWAFVAHHKTGTTVGEDLARVLCRASGRPVFVYTYREAVQSRSAFGDRPLCHFLVKAYSVDVEQWRAFLDERPSNRLVHFVRGHTHCARARAVAAPPPSEPSAEPAHATTLPLPSHTTHRLYMYGRCATP